MGGKGQLQGPRFGASASGYGLAVRCVRKTCDVPCVLLRLFRLLLFLPLFREFCLSLRALNVSENLADSEVQQPVLARTA